jgi:protein TonB
VSVNSEKSFDALVVNEPHRPQAAVFGGQLLGESSVQSDPVPSTGSKKGLFLGLAAAALLILGGAWYFQQYHARNSNIAPVKPVASPSFAASSPVSKLSASGAASTPASNTVIPAPVSSPAAPQPAKNSAPVSTQAVSATAPEPKNSNPAPRNTAPVEPAKRSALGDVHLAAPVVNRGADSQQDADTLPAMETDSSPSGADPLAAVASVHHKEPVAPLPVGGDVKPAQLLKSVPPVYPAMAKTQRISGNVQIDALIDSIGNVAAVKVLSGPPILRRAALDAVKQWKYSPAQLNGQPTSMHLTVIVQFRAQ